MALEQNATESDTCTPDAIDAQLAHLLIESPSLTDQELADKLGISRQTANRRKNAQAVQKIIRSTLSMPEKEMRRLTKKALSRLEALLDNEDPKVKLSAILALMKYNNTFMGNAIDMGVW